MNEKRKHPRVNIHVLAYYDCYNDDGELFEQNLGVILDVSLGGLLIQTKNLVEANYIKIVFVSHKNKVLSITGSVTHSRKMDIDKANTGVCFHGSESENIKIVTNLIRTYNHAKKSSH